MTAFKTQREDLSNHPDEDLVALVRDGDGSAFGAIMQRYKDDRDRISAPRSRAMRSGGLSQPAVALAAS